MIRLLADIGGTNARFALAEAGGMPAEERHLQVRDFAEPSDAIDRFLAGRRVSEAVIAVATPIESDEVRFTNSHWAFSIEALRRRHRFERLAVINDFVAQALAMPHLAPDEVEQIGGGAGAPDRPIGVLGPGTGLGVSGLIPGRGSWTALATEGGHVSFAPGSPREQAVLDVLRQRFGHVSNERVLSGQGLLNLAQALATVDDRTCAAGSPEDVSEQARDDRCPSCREAVALFSGVLGAAAGNLALVYGAQGGVFVAGGICLRLGPLFDRAAFRQRFEDKGRMRRYVEPIPVWLVLRRNTGLIGAAHFRDAA
jgi:glucokinase